MSFKALSWALGCEMSHSPSKFVLIVLANYADADNVCYPSVMRLSKDCCLNRKTVISALKKLKDGGFISDTGDRRGRTGKTIVYHLLISEQQDVDVNGTNIGTVSGVESPQKLSTTSTNNGTVKDDGGGGNGTEYPTNSPICGTTKQSHMWYSEPIINKPITNQKQALNPAGLFVPAWDLWITYRRENNFKEYSPLSISSAMSMMISFGDDQLAVVQNAIAKQWKHLHPINSIGGNGNAKSGRSSMQIFAEGTAGAFEP